MKKIFYFVSCMMLSMALSLTSCDDDDPISTPEPEQEMAEYTLMLYGCSGGNLDQAMANNLDQALSVGANDKVKMTCQVKFSTNYQNDPDLKGTRRFILEDKNKDGDVDEETILDVSLPLYDPANLAEFIQWSKERCPAQNYILILWNHGNGWYPISDRPKTKGIFFDDNANEECLSLDDLIAGVKQSDTHLKMLYYDACLMGMLENYSGLTEISDYVLGSAHTVPGLGGNYASLIENLTEQDDFEPAIRQYIHEVVSLWGAHPDIVSDLALANLSSWSKLMDAMKLFTDELVNTYEEDQEQYDIATNNCYRFTPNYPFFDIMDYMRKLANFSGNPELISYTAQAQRALDDIFVYQELTGTLVSEGQSISLGVTMIENGRWIIDNELNLNWDGSVTDMNGQHLKSWGSTGDETYGKLAFDKATGWSRWLKMNQQLPTDNPCFGSDHDEDEGEDDNIDE